LLLAALGATSVGLVACSSPNRTAPAATSAPSASKPGPTPASGTVAQPVAKPTAKPQPRAGGTLRVARQGDTSSMYPWGNAAATGLTVKLAYERLTRYDDDLNAQNWLARDIDVSPDAREWKVTLQKGVQFHNGKELTSADVAYTWKKIQDPKVSASARTMATWFKSTEQPDATTIVFKADQPRAAATDLFEYMDIVDAVTMEKGPETINGTGPFKFGSRKEGVSWDMVKHPNYWRTGRPYLDGVHVELFADAQAKTVAFESGAADVLEGPSVRDVVRYEQEKKYGIVALSGFLYMFAINTTKPPFDNKLARQALQHAVDRKRIFDVVFSGKGEARNLPWPKSSEAYQAEKANSTPFDLDRAKRMLNEAGVTGATIDIISNAPLIEVTAMGQVVQGDFQKIGLTTNLKPLETAAWGDAGELLEFSGLNAALTSFVAIRPSTLPLASSFFRIGDNRSGWNNPEYKRIAEAAGAEPNVAKRKELLYQMNTLFLEDSPIVFVGAAGAYLILDPKAHAVGRDQNYQLDVYDAWLD
jgi:peptide/nickel transport system substrate-binding protein